MTGFEDFTDGVELTAGEIDSYLMRQTVPRFPTEANLLANVPAGIRETGMHAYAGDTDIEYVFDGTVWRPLNSGGRRSYRCGPVAPPLPSATAR